MYESFETTTRKCIHKVIFLLSVLTFIVPFYLQCLFIFCICDCNYYHIMGGGGGGRNHHLAQREDGRREMKDEKKKIRTQPTLTASTVGFYLL